MKQFKRFLIEQTGFYKITWYVTESDNPKSFSSYSSLSFTTVLLPLFTLRITMSSYCFNSSIACFSTFDRFGFCGLAQSFLINQKACSCNVINRKDGANFPAVYSVFVSNK